MERKVNGFNKYFVDLSHVTGLFLFLFLLLFCSFLLFCFVFFILLFVVFLFSRSNPRAEYQSKQHKYIIEFLMVEKKMSMFADFNRILLTL